MTNILHLVSLVPMSQISLKDSATQLLDVIQLA